MVIMVVDDSKVVRLTMVTILKQLGYHEVMAFSNVQEARAALEETSFDLILTDWNMPGESGIDFLRFLRRNPSYAKIPVVMVTTVSEREKIYEAARAGLQSYLFKPIQKEVLAEKLTSLAATYHFQAPGEAAASAGK